MPRTEAANQRIRETQRAKILEGAMKVFARKGMAATMAEVAAAAGVSQGLAYRYFANKEAIVNTLVEQAVQTGITALPHVLEMPSTPGERLDTLFSRLVEGRREHPEFYQLLYQVPSDEAAPDHLRELIARQGQAFQDGLRQLIVEGQATGEVAYGDPDQLATAVMAYLDGLTRLAVYNPERFKRHFPDVGIVLRMLKPASDKTAERESGRTGA